MEAHDGGRPLAEGQQNDRSHSGLGLVLILPLPIISEPNLLNGLSPASILS